MVVCRQLHENLLLRHFSLFQSNPGRAETRDGQLCSRNEGDDDSSSPEQQNPAVAGNLQDLHQAILSRIRQRHAALCDRAMAWEQYRSALSKLLTWLDAAERERKHLVLRQIQEHGLPTALHRVIKKKRFQYLASLPYIFFVIKRSSCCWTRSVRERDCRPIWNERLDFFLGNWATKTAHLPCEPISSRLQPV